MTNKVFRYNNRAAKENKVTDADRFSMAISRTVGQRLIFAALTGERCDPALPPRLGRMTILQNSTRAEHPKLS
ncbi:MAG TPA: hypothetical protein VII95_06315 [Terriglobales bacterium]